MTAGEKQTYEALIKEQKATNQKLDRLIRMLSIQNTMAMMDKADDLKLDIKDIITTILFTNDIFEDTVKTHALEAAFNKRKEKEENV